MSKETLSKYASISQYNRKKCFALGNWCNKQGNIFSLQEVFDCLYDYANGNAEELTKLIEQLTTKGKVFGRSSVVFGNGDSNMYIMRGEDGKLEVRAHKEDFEGNKVGQHQPHDPNVVRKDGQVKKTVIKAREKLYDLGAEVRSVYKDQSNEFITAAIKAVKEFAKEHKISEKRVVSRLKSGIYTLDMTDGKKPKVTQSAKTIKLYESQLNDISDVTKLTEYKFYNNVQRFLSDLLRDPVGAKVPFLLQANNIARNQLLYHLKSNGIINRYQKISDKDSQGNPKTARMIIKYSVPKKDFAKKMKRLFIDLVAKNVPQKIEKILTEECSLDDQLKLMKGSSTTMGLIGHPKYTQTDEYAEIFNKKKKEIEECDGGAAPAESTGATNCQSSGAFVQPLFGVQRRKIKEDTTASGVTQNGDISGGIIVPFASDKETKDRTPGFSVRDTQMLTESAQDKRVQNFLKNKGYSDYNERMEIIGKTKHDIPNIRLDNGKFLLGCLRMFFDGQLRDEAIIRNVDNALKQIHTDGHTEEFDENLNGKNPNDLYNMFRETMKQNAHKDRERSAKRAFGGGSNYKIIPINSFEEAEPYGRYTSWCVTHGKSAFESYTKGGNRFYFCLRNGFQSVPKDDENAPLNEWGLSMIAVNIDMEGNLTRVTTRYNHDYHGENNPQLETPEQLENVLNVPFYQTFKPYTRQKLLDMGIIPFDMVQELLDSGKKPNEIFQFVGDFKEGFAKVKLNGKNNFINREGRLISSTWFDYCGDFKEGFAAVRLNGKYNFINRECRLISSTWFDNCWDFKEGYAMVELNGERYYINGEGRLL